MDSKIQSLLKSPLPEDRKQGIKMLAKSSDPQTLKLLSALHKRETDPEVKQLIVQAGKVVKQRIDAGGSVPAEAPAKPARPAKSSAEWALLKQAQTAMIEVDYVNAKALARKAFEMNPDLRQDAEALRILGDVFGTTPQEAVAMLGGDDAESSEWLDDLARTQAKPKRKQKAGTTDNTTWGEALLDVGIYGLFSGGLLFIVMLFIIFIMGDALQAIANTSTMSSDTPMSAAQMAQFFSTLGLALAFIYGVIVAIISMVSYLIWFGIIHFVATSFLGGRGSYAGILHRMMVPMIVWLVINYILGAVALYVSFSSIASATTFEQLQQANNANSLFQLVDFAAGVAFTFWLATIIGEHYVFGTGKGCLSIIISYALIIALGCGCAFFFTFALARSMSSAFPVSFIPLLFW